MFIEIIKFLIYSILIVIISKYVLVKALRRLAENLNLSPRIVGNISGVATSIPELLTVTISSFRGLLGTSLYNIMSSNVINVVQYVISLVINKNHRIIKNKGIMFQMFLVILTIIIPIVLLKLENTINLIVVLILVTIYIILQLLSKRIHSTYLADEEKQIEQDEIEEEQKEKSKNKKTYVYILYIFVAGILLYVIGSALGSVLENLANIFGIAEFVLGILLGVITSIPEFITFFESQKHYKKNEGNSLLGVIEATNNLLTSNMLNLFIIQSIGILIYIWL